MVCAVAISSGLDTNLELREEDDDDEDDDEEPDEPDAGSFGRAVALGM